MTSYAVPGTEPFLRYERPWSEVAGQVSAISKTLGGDDSDITLQMIQAARSPFGGVGGVLFRLLFGSEDHRERLFRTAFHRPGGAIPNPTFAPLLLQLCTAEPDLLALPWRLTTWQERPLVGVGWVFKTGEGCESTADYIPHRRAARYSSSPPEHPRLIPSTSARSAMSWSRYGLAGHWRICARSEPGLRWSVPYAAWDPISSMSMAPCSGTPARSACGWTASQPPTPSR